MSTTLIDYWWQSENAKTKKTQNDNDSKPTTRGDSNISAFVYVEVTSA